MPDETLPPGFSPDPTGEDYISDLTDQVEDDPLDAFEEDDEDDSFVTVEDKPGDFEDNDFVEQVGSQWDAFDMEQAYHYHSGCIQLPVADDDIDGSVASEIVQLECPWSQRIVSFSGSRQGYQPDVPDPFLDIADNEILLDAVTRFSRPAPHSSGKAYIYSAAGTYTYASVKPRVPIGPSNTLTLSGDGGLQPSSQGSGDGEHYFVMGKAPILKDSSSDANAFSTKHFVTGQTQPDPLNDDDGSDTA